MKEVMLRPIDQCFLMIIMIVYPRVDVEVEYIRDASHWPDKSAL